MKGQRIIEVRREITVHRMILYTTVYFIDVDLHRKDQKKETTKGEKLTLVLR